MRNSTYVLSVKKSVRGIINILAFRNNRFIKNILQTETSSHSFNKYEQVTDFLIIHMNFIFVLWKDNNLQINKFLLVFMYLQVNQLS